MDRIDREYHGRDATYAYVLRFEDAGAQNYPGSHRNVDGPKSTREKIASVLGRRCVRVRLGLRTYSLLTLYRYTDSSYRIFPSSRFGFGMHQPHPLFLTLQTE